MKLIKLLVLGVCLAAGLPCGLFAVPESTNSAAENGSKPQFRPPAAEVMKLAQSGVGDEVLTAYINNSRSEYDLTAHDIVALKEAGLSSGVLSTMLSHDAALRSQTQSANQVAASAAPTTATAQQNAPMVTAPLTPVPPASTASSVPQVTSPAPVVVEQTPPSLRVEVVPVAPGPEYTWAPGCWSWRGGRWVWVSGVWVLPPRPRAVWVGGYWGPHPRGHVWVGGHWR